MVNLRPIQMQDLEQLQDLCEACKDYFQFQEGAPVTEDTAVELFHSAPPNLGRGKKSMLGIYLTVDSAHTSGDTPLVGAVELVEHYPSPGTLTIALLVIRPMNRRQGIGTITHRFLAALAAAGGMQRLRLGVLLGNHAGYRFWTKLGYRETGEIKPYKHNRFAVLEKLLDTGADRTDLIAP